MHLTIKDIARESGCAVSTVSRALNDHPDISPKTKAKVKAVVARCGFVPNSNARQLKVQQSHSLLVLVKGVANLFFAALLEQVQAQISKAGYSAEVHYLDEDADEMLAAQQLQREHKPLGFLFLGGNGPTFAQRFDDLALPCVLATTLFDTPRFPNLSCVGVDDVAAGDAACAYLLARGHRRIAVLGGNRERSHISALRYGGFCDAYVRGTGAPHPARWYQMCQFNLQSAHQATQKLLADGEGMTALFCMSDITAIGAMRAVHDAGLRVPQDISVLGFDGVALGRFCTPRLATVRQPGQEIAAQSVALLLAQIEKRAAAQRVVLPAVLVEGESVCEVGAAKRENAVGGMV